MGSSRSRLRNSGLGICVIVGFLLCHGCSPKDTISSSKHTWRLVYKNDSEGQAILGDKEELINAVRSGLPIRIGWGGRLARDTTMTIEHLAEARFVTVLNNSDVFAQVAQIVGQQPSFEKGALKVRFRESNMWTKIVGTNGYSQGHMFDITKDSILSDGKDRKAGTVWFVLSNATTSDITPLWSF